MLARPRRDRRATSPDLLPPECLVHEAARTGALRDRCLRLLSPPAARRRPAAQRRREVAAVMKYCHRYGIPVVPRGAGTSLSGGAIPQEDAVVLGLSKMNRILDIDYANRAATVQAGVTNLEHLRSRLGRRLLLCARPELAARLHDRRQYRHEFRRRPLPEIRRHHQQPARRQDGADRRHGDRARRQGTRCRRLRPARPRLRLTRASSASSPRQRCA